MNTIMQTAFFAISGVLPREQAIEEIKHAIEKTYGKRGEAVVKKNFEAVDATIANLHEVKVPAKVTSKMTRRSAVPNEAPDFVHECAWAHDQLRRRQPPRIRHSVDGSYPARHNSMGKAQSRARYSRLGSQTCASNAANA